MSRAAWHAVLIVLVLGVAAVAFAGLVYEGRP